MLFSIVVWGLSVSALELLVEITAVFVAHAVDYISYGSIGVGQKIAGSLKPCLHKQILKGNSEIFADKSAEIGGGKS